jgi:serine/threonine protein kinase
MIRKTKKKYNKKKMRSKKGGNLKSKIMESNSKCMSLNTSLKHEIGKGEFGSVYYGKFDGVDTAIKIIKLPKNGIYPREMVKETELLSELNDSDFISKVLGICDSFMLHNENALLIFLELTKYGDLSYKWKYK